MRIKPQPKLSIVYLTLADLTGQPGAVSQDDAIGYTELADAIYTMAKDPEAALKQVPVLDAHGYTVYMTDKEFVVRRVLPIAEIDNDFKEQVRRLPTAGYAWQLRIFQ